MTAIGFDVDERKIDAIAAKPRDVSKLTGRKHARTVAKTATVSKNLSPEWNEKVLTDFIVGPKARKDPTVRLCVFDYDLMSASDPMGEVVIPLERLLDGPATSSANDDTDVRKVMADLIAGVVEAASAEQVRLLELPVHVPRAAPHGEAHPADVVRALVADGRRDGAVAVGVEHVERLEVVVRQADARVVLRERLHDRRPHHALRRPLAARRHARLDPLPRREAVGRGEAAAADDLSVELPSVVFAGPTAEPLAVDETPAPSPVEAKKRETRHRRKKEKEEAMEIEEETDAEIRDGERMDEETQRLAASLGFTSAIRRGTCRHALLEAMRDKPDGITVDEIIETSEKKGLARSWKNSRVPKNTVVSLMGDKTFSRIGRGLYVLTCYLNAEDGEKTPRADDRKKRKATTRGLEERERGA